MRRAEPGALRSTSSLRSGRRPFSSLRGKTHLKEQPLGKQPFSPGKVDRKGLREWGKFSLGLPTVSKFVRRLGILIALEELRPFPLPEEN